MKFPLPLDTFPAVALSEHEERELEAAAAAVVKHTMREYHEHLSQNGGGGAAMDERRWKKIKQLDDVRVYSDRQAPHGGLADDPELEGAQLRSMLAFGTIEGRLEDILYGAMCPTTEAMRLKTAYVQNGFEDWKVIAPIREPSENDPLRELNVKWTAKGHPHFNMMLNARDIVYIESIGIVQMLNGERVGYLLHHSVTIPGIRELTEYQIVRAKISFCYIFRQMDGNRAELFARGMFAPMGGVPMTLAMAPTVECSKSISGKFKLSSASRDKHCRICSARVCSRCRVHKTVYQQVKLKEVTSADMAFCTRCLLRVTSAHSSEFAKLDARAARGEEVDYFSALGA